MSDNWPTNHQRAEQMLAHADEVEWETLNFKLADRLRAEAEHLLKDPHHQEPPF